METPRRLTDEDFAYIYTKVPRLNVDLVIRADGGVVLVKRAIEPHVGAWHLPGGTVYKNEKLSDAAVRVAKNETGLDVEVVKQVGFMEFPNEKRGDLVVHTITVAIEVTKVGGELKHDAHAKEIKIFHELPPVEEGIDQHFDFLKSNKILL